VLSLERESGLNEFDGAGRVAPHEFRRHVDSVNPVGEESSIAYGVSLPLGSILLPVDFDRQPGLRAPEVWNVAVDKGPMPELEAAEPSGTKQLPKSSLRCAGSATETTGLSGFARRSFATSHEAATCQR